MACWLMKCWNSAAGWPSCKPKHFCKSSCWITLPEWWPSSPSSNFLRQLIYCGTICLLTRSGMVLTTGCCSWLGKLETAKRVLVDDAPKTLPSEDALANAFIYLQVQSLAFCRSLTL